MKYIKNAVLSGAAVALFGITLRLVPEKPASAQQAACVNLLVGAGYAAWMGVKFGDT
ncbi:MAG: hypothetical protein ACK4QW_03975 [Alphaproteobacteria bacterium]